VQALSGIGDGNGWDPMMNHFAYCPNCRSVQRLAEVQEGDQPRFWCYTCGHPVEADQVEEGTSPDRPPTVLCIDDDQLVLRITCDALNRCGFQTLIATDGPTGIGLAKGERPDLILLDILMPEMSGLEVCRRLRADPDIAGTPIILLTALNDPNLDPEGSQAGATLTLRKSFSPEVIVEAIERILGRKREPRMS